MSDINFNNLPPSARVREKSVLAVTGLSRSTIRRLVKGNKFPAPFKEGRMSLWYWGDVSKWLDDDRNGGAK